MPDRTWQTDTLIRVGLISILVGILFHMYNFFGVTDVGYDAHDSTRSAFRWIYNRWLGDWLGTRYAHSHWIPLISLALVWRDRRALMALPKKMFVPGLLVIFLGLALHWAGVKSQQTRLTILSMIVLSWALPLFVCGWSVARRLLFPCGFLVFSLPLNFFDAAAYPLRLISASIAAGIASGLGIDITRAGAVIYSNSTGGFSTNLADSQNGIFAVTAAVAFAFLCSYLIHTRMRWRLAVVASGIPFVMLATVVRGVLILLVAESFGVEAAGALYKKLSGLFNCLITFGGIGVLSWWLNRRFGSPRVVVASAPPINPPSINRALGISLLLITAAASWIPGNLHINYIEEAGVNTEFPADIGEWHGGLVLFCHNHEETGDLLDPNLKIGDPCPQCGAPLEEMTGIERALLPPDTVVRKNRYVNNKTDRRVYLSIVLSGKYRSSIHRPEVCLVGPNSQIARSFIHSVPINEKHNLRVKVLEMIIQSTDSNGKPHTSTTYYAYWFAGIGRETPSHLTRMRWMASDRLFKNTSYRWAYISLSGMRGSSNTDYLSEINTFLREAYPYLVRRASPVDAKAEAF